MHLSHGFRSGSRSDCRDNARRGVHRSRVPRALTVAAVVLLAAGGPAAVATAGPPAGRTDPRTATAELTLPAIDVKDLRVVPYKGTTDDGRRARDPDPGPR